MQMILLGTSSMAYSWRMMIGNMGLWHLSETEGFPSERTRENPKVTKSSRSGEERREKNVSLVPSPLSLFKLMYPISEVCTAKVNLSDEVDFEDYVSRPDKISAAEIAAICQEAGMHAVRKNRYVILPKDFEKGYRSNVKKPDTDFEFYK